MFFSTLLVVLVHNQLLCYFIYCWESSCHDRRHALEQGIHLMEAGRQTKQKKYLARTSCLPCLASSLYVSIPSLVAHGHTSSKKFLLSWLLHYSPSTSLTGKPSLPDFTLPALIWRIYHPLAPTALKKTCSPINHVSSFNRTLLHTVPWHVCWWSESLSLAFFCLFFSATFFCFLAQLLVKTFNKRTNHYL